MHPILFEVFGFKVHTYGVLLVLGFFAGVWLARRRAVRFGFTREKVSDVLFWALIAGVLGARIVYILQELPDYLKNPKELLSLQFAGLTSFGGVIFGLGAVLFWCWRSKSPTRAFLDTVGPSLLIGHAIGRVGCLLNGCCYGRACDAGFPLGVHVDKMPGLYQPAQIYDSLMNLAALGLILWIEKRGLRSGQVFALVIVGHGLSRFIYEFWRAGTSSTYWGSLPITQAQAAAAAMSLCGIGLFFYFQHRQRQEVPAT